MTPLRQTNFLLEDDIADALKRIKERDGIPIAEQIRRALAAWVESKGETVRKEKPKSPKK